jgi:hypothetical protein
MSIDQQIFALSDVKNEMSKKAFWPLPYKQVLPRVTWYRIVINMINKNEVVTFKRSCQQTLNIYEVNRRNQLAADMHWR